MKKSTFIKFAFGFILAAMAVGCAQDSSKSSSSSRRGYCDPNTSYNCSSAYGGYNNQYYGNGYNSGCGANGVNTSYGCLPRGNCPMNYGYSMQSNQCIPAQGGYNQYGNGYNNGYNNYNNGYYNSGYNNGYYNSGYNNGYYNSGYNNGYNYGNGYGNGYYGY